MMQFLKAINALLAFSLEIAMVTLITWWGSSLARSTWAKWGLGLVFMAIPVVLWGIYAAPKSDMRLKLPWRLLFITGMYATAAYASFKMLKGNWTLAFVCLSLISLFLEYLTETSE